MEAISQAGSAVGVLANDGVVLAAEKRITSDLLDLRKSAEKTYKIDEHVACAVAGITADANILLNQARLDAQRYKLTYQEPMPLDQLMTRLCDLKQSYTQFGGLRPFGVSFLFAGWDEHFGFQLFQSDPSGNYGGWKATAIGANNSAAQSILKTDYKIDETTLDDALMLSLKVLSKTMDTSVPSPDKLEISTITRNDRGEVEFRILGQEDLKALVKKAEDAGILSKLEDGDKA